MNREAHHNQSQDLAATDASFDGAALSAVPLARRARTSFAIALEQFSIAAFLREIGVGLPMAFSMLAASLAAGVLVYDALGSQFVAVGAVSGIVGALFGGVIACVVSSNSMILWGPLVTISLVQANLVSTLAAEPLFPSNIVTALFACTALAGVLQIAFSFSGLANIVKYTPHPVLAGFVDGVSASIFFAQIKIFLPHSWMTFADGVFLVRPAMALFVVLLVAFNFWFSSRIKIIPSQLATLAVAMVGYHGFLLLFPDVDLGPTLGELPFDLLSVASFGMDSAEMHNLFFITGSKIVLFAVATVIVGSFQSLLAFKMAENMLGKPVVARRGLLALGIGDLVSAFAGGLAITVAAPMTAAVFRNGGRTRIVGLTVGATLLIMVVLLPHLLGAIPRAVVVALLFIVSITAFDRWSVRLLSDVLRGVSRPEGRRAYFDLFVVLLMVAVTLFVSIVPAILAGFAGACISFAMNMSRPIIRRRLVGLRSKHVRTTLESVVLRQHADRWLVLRLSGVLFFGNCEALSREVAEAFTKTDTILMDCRGVTDIDASGANILSDLFEKSRKWRKRLLFCNVPGSFQSVVQRMAGGAGAANVFADIDSALEWIEDEIIRQHATGQPPLEPLELDRHEFVQGLSKQQCELLSSLLLRRTFERGDILAFEGEPGDRMWLLAEGSVNVMIRLNDRGESRRIASLGVGTTVGEMALIENAHRSATIVVAEDLVCWELNRSAYAALMAEHPDIGNRLLTNLVVEMSHRIRNTSDQLRELES